MDDLEQRLSTLLERVSHQADPAVARLRNPAEVQRRPSRRTGLRSHPLLASVAVTAVVATTALGIATTVHRLDHRPAPPASGSQGSTDGEHPLWPLETPTAPSRSIARLPVAHGAVPLPVPHSLDPGLVPELTSTPTLVTRSGTTRFSAKDVSSVLPLAERGERTFVVVTRPPRAGESPRPLHVLVISPNNPPREILGGAYRDAAVSPDGTRLAVAWLTKVAVYDTATGGPVYSVSTQTVAGVTWASDQALLLRATGRATTNLVWRAPRTEQPVRVQLPFTAAQTVQGGIVAFDDDSGCLRKLDASATVTAVTCGGWHSAGPASPDGRYVPLERRTADGDTARGVLDVTADRVRSWPVNGINPSWLGPTKVLLTDATVEDSPPVALCDLGTDRCEQVTDAVRKGAWRGADWLGR